LGRGDRFVSPANDRFCRVARGNFTPRRSTGREPLDSHGSRCSALDIRKAPVCEERWICAVNALQPFSRTRMPPGQSSGPPRACPGRWVHPRFRHRLIPYEPSSTVCFRSPPRTLPAGILSRLFPQRSPLSLLTTAPCGGLRPAPECRPRGACPHLLYSSTPPFLAMCS